MSFSSKPAPATPLRATRFKSATPGTSPSTRVQCSDDPADFALVKIHTAKCSICDKRNATDEMRRCKGCTWQICRPCQAEREQKGRSLAHGNLMTATPSGSTARRRILHSIGPKAEVKDPEVEAALVKAKEEQYEKALANKEATKSTDGAQEVITPPSSNERTKHKRKAKDYKSLAELDMELDDDDEELQVRDKLSPLGKAGSKRRLTNKDESSTVTHESPSKRACSEQSQPMQGSTPLPSEWTMSPRDKADLRSKTYTNLEDVRGIHPSQHSTLIKDKSDVDIVPGTGYTGGQTQGQSTLHCNMPAPDSRLNKISMAVAYNGRRRKTGEEFMEEVRNKVRKNLAERYAWPLQVPAITNTPPTASTACESAAGNLRDLVDNEARTLHHNLTLDDDQQNELLSAMKEVARKFGKEIIKSMPAGFRAMVKPGLELALEYLTGAQQQQVIALVQTQAANKLKEFEEEADIGTVGNQNGLRPERLHVPRESIERST